MLSILGILLITYSEHQRHISTEIVNENDSNNIDEEINMVSEPINNNKLSNILILSFSDQNLVTSATPSLEMQEISASN